MENILKIVDDFMELHLKWIMGQYEIWFEFD